MFALHSALHTQYKHPLQNIFHGRKDKTESFSRQEANPFLPLSLLEGFMLTKLIFKTFLQVDGWTGHCFEIKEFLLIIYVRINGKDV